MNKRKNKKLKYILFIILVIFFITSILCIFKHVKREKTENILENIKIDESKITNVVSERMLKLEELQKQNSDIVGWLELEGTNINYPVLQTTNNDFYLNHNYKKENVLGGSLFLDKDFNLNKPSTNYLIYGHRMTDGTMFEDLLKYADEEFYKSHRKIRFTTNKEDSEYEVLAVFYSRVYYKSEKNVFRYYYFVNAENENEYNDFVNNAKSVSIYDTGINAEYGDQLLTLSTCEYSQEDGRFAVVYKKIK